MSVTLDQLATLTPAQAALVLEEEALRRARRRRFFKLFPAEGPLRRELYPKHMAFFRHGRNYRQRAFMAANRVGKTYAGLYETICHATGRYPEWWVGRRFNRPVRIWIAGDTSKSVREGLQEKLLGPWGEHGTGLLPGDDLIRATPKQGVPETIDTVAVRHVSGGISRIEMKSYDQKRISFQSTERDVILLDEEPPDDIYGECLLRTTTNNGLIILTFTPLNGVSAVVNTFLTDGTPIEGPIPDTSRVLVMASWDDVPHLSAEVKAEMIREIPEHMRAARTQGIPLLGSGLVFQFAESDYLVNPFEIPPSWPQGAAMDFGWDHPWGASSLAWDRDQDVIYVTRATSMRMTTPVLAWAAVKNWGEWLRWAWPHDGLQHDKGSGEQLKEQYKAAGFKMMDERATFADGTFGVEAGVLEMYQRFQTQRLRVFRGSCDKLLPEMRTYHRKDGLIVKANDDIISSVRYGIMMRRYFGVKPRNSKLRIHNHWKTS